MFRKKRDCTIRIAKTKALIRFAVTAKLICVFVFAYSKSRFSHEEAHLMFFGVCVSCRILYSFVGYLYVGGSGSITSVKEERANLSASVYLLLERFPLPLVA